MRMGLAAQCPAKGQADRGRHYLAGQHGGIVPPIHIGPASPPAVNYRWAKLPFIMRLLLG